MAFQTNKNAWRILKVTYNDQVMNEEVPRRANVQHLQDFVGETIKFHMSDDDGLYWMENV